MTKGLGLAALSLALGAFASSTLAAPFGAAPRIEERDDGRQYRWEYEDDDCRLEHVIDRRSGSETLDERGDCRGVTPPRGRHFNCARGFRDDCSLTNEDYVYERRARRGGDFEVTEGWREAPLAPSGADTGYFEPLEQRDWRSGVLARPERRAPRSFALGGAARALVEQARRQSAGGDHALAVASLERALKIEPDNPLLWIEVARVRQAEGNHAQAETMARRALSGATGDAAAESAAWRVIAETLRARGRVAEAREAEERAERPRPAS